MTPCPRERPLRRRAPLALSACLLVAAPAAGRTPAAEEPAAPPQSAPAQSTPADEVALRVITENVRVWMETGALERAASEVERLLRRAPGSAPARLLAVEVHFRLGRDAEVERHAAAARALDPASPEADRWLARLARWRGRLDDARRHQRRAVERDPRSGALLAELATLYAAEGRHRRARSLFRRAALAELEEPGPALDAALGVNEPRRRDAALRRLHERFPDYAPGGAWAALCGSIPGATLWEAEPWAAPLEIPLELEQGHFPIVEAALGGGPPARLLLDTGSPGLKISRALAERLGLERFGSLQVSGLGSGRPASADLVLVDTLRLGPLTLRRVPATVLEALPMADGLLNPMALGAEAARLDVTRRRLVLGDNERLVPAGGTRLPFLSLDQHPLVRLLLNGRPRFAMIDSGSGATVLDESVVRQMPGRRPMVLEGIDFSLSGVLGAVRDARPVHVTRLRLGPIDLDNPILFEADLSRFGEFLGTEVQMLFGADFLSRFDATFDYRNLEVTLEPAQRRKAPGIR